MYGKDLQPFESSRPLRLVFLVGILLALLVATGAPGTAYAAESARLPKQKQTSLGLYFTATEAFEHMRQHGNTTLFVDVRDPVEVNFTGMPSVADANVPFKLVDTSKWHLKKKQFNMKTNANFAVDVEKRLAAKGLSKADTVILMCRSGPRGAKAANVLAKNGFTRVYNLVDGFEGDAVKEGPASGQRTLNGWKNAQLPWDAPKGLEIAKIYGDPEPFLPGKK